MGYLTKKGDTLHTRGVYITNERGYLTHQRGYLTHQRGYLVKRGYLTKR